MEEPGTAGAGTSAGVEALVGDSKPLEHREVRKPVVQAVRWTVLATLARQCLQILGALVLARLLGPAVYGVISLATLYVVVVGLILDQGLSAALIQREKLDHGLPGAVATLNFGLAVALAIVTWVVAPFVERYFSAAPLSGILRVLALALLVKAAMIVPRALLTRSLNFKTLGKADILGAVVGTCVAIAAALFDQGAYSIVYLTVATDITVLVVLLKLAPTIVPNLRLSLLPPILPFSLRIFATNAIAACSRNTDNVLVARYLGVTQLSFYAMAYRVLVMPVQMVGQTAARFMFPLLAGEARSKDAMQRHLYQCTQVLAATTVPVMVWVSCASDQLVALVLGPAWQATAIVLSVLAIAGARETVFYVTPSLMKATGRAKLNLRFEIFSTLVQVTGIVAGLQFGLVGVAVGYTIAGFLVTPVLMLVQRNLAGLRLARQFKAVIPAIVSSAVAAVGFMLVDSLPLANVQTLMLGSCAYLALFVLCGFFVFRDWRRDLWYLVKQFTWGSRNGTSSSTPVSDR